MTRTRSSRSISSVMATRTASIILISATDKSPSHIVQRPGRFWYGRLDWTLGQGHTPGSLGGTRNFVLGRRQERDGQSSAGQAMLSAERVAGHLFRLAWPVDQEAERRPGCLFLAAPDPDRARGRQAGSGRRPYGCQIPGSQD